MEQVNVVDERVREVIRRFGELEKRLADPAVLGDPEKLREVAREHAELAPAARAAERLLRVRQRLAEASGGRCARATTRSWSNWPGRARGAGGGGGGR